MARFRKDRGAYDADSSESGYENRIRAHKQNNLYRILLIIAAVVVVAIIVRLQFLNHVYSGYEIQEQVDRSDASFAMSLGVDNHDAASTKDIRLGSSLLTYSRDGAHLTNASGEVLWNQTYEIQDIRIATNGGTVAIGNYNGREIYVGNETQYLGSITTNMPIRSLSVAGNGNVTAILADTDVTWINTYSPTGTLLFSGQTHMANSGYPTATALNSDASLLAVSFIYVDSGVVKSTVAFYNFGSVGDNYTDYLVSGFDYTDLLIPQVGFLNDSTAYAVGDNRLMLYQGVEQPAVKAEYLFDNEVRGVYAENGYVGLVFASDKADSRYRLDVYSPDGLVKKFYFTTEYTDILFEKKDFIIYNESECLIQTYEGKVKFEGTFGESAGLMLPTSGTYKYVLVGNNQIETIQLN